MMPSLFRPPERMKNEYPITDEVSEGIAKIREDMKGSIPSDLDTDYNLRRWWIGHQGNIKEIHSKLSSYIANRKAAKFDSDDFLKIWDTIPAVRRVLCHLSLSKLQGAVNLNDNSVLFFDRQEGIVYEKLLKKIKVSDFMLAHFAIGEYLLQQVLKEEEKSKQPHGLTVVLDMGGIGLSDYISPSSCQTALWKQCASMMQDSFCEILHKLIFLNPPSVVKFAWALLKRFLNPKTCAKVVMVNNARALTNHLPIELIPVAYGGSLVDTTGWGHYEMCVNRPKPIHEKDYAIPGAIWENFLLNQPTIVEQQVKPKEKVTVTWNVKLPGNYLAWQFWTNAPLEFGIKRIDHKENGISEEQSEAVIAYFVLETLKLPEEGKVLCEIPGQYEMEFRNSAGMFSTKLTYAVALIE